MAGLPISTRCTKGCCSVPFEAMFSSRMIGRRGIDWWADAPRLNYSAFGHFPEMPAQEARSNCCSMFSHTDNSHAWLLHAGRMHAEWMASQSPPQRESCRQYLSVVMRNLCNFAQEERGRPPGNGARSDGASQEPRGQLNYLKLTTSVTIKQRSLRIHAHSSL